MNEVQALLIELLEEMQGLNETEIQEVRNEWIKKLKEKGNTKAIGLANIVCDIAIAQYKKVA